MSRRLAKASGKNLNDACALAQSQNISILLLLFKSESIFALRNDGVN